MLRALIIHKATSNEPPFRIFGKEVFSTPDDLSINIIELASEPAYKAEGVGLADALWNTLPAITIDAMLARFTELQDSHTAAIFKARLGI